MPVNPGAIGLHDEMGEGAVIVPLQGRRRLAGSHPSDHERGPMRGLPGYSAAQPDSASSQDRDTVLGLLANDMEQAFNAAGRTLTDQETAAVYSHTLSIVKHLLRGAAAQGVISDGQRNELWIMLDGVREAPRHL